LQLVHATLQATSKAETTEAPFLCSTANGQQLEQGRLRRYILTYGHANGRVASGSDNIRASGNVFGDVGAALPAAVSGQAAMSTTESEQAAATSANESEQAATSEAGSGRVVR
jgi:hypothetical protein